MPNRILRSTITVWGLFLLLAVTAFAFCGGTPVMAATGHLPFIGIAGVVMIRNLFTREAIIRYLQILGPAYPTVIMDTIFKDRPQQPGPLVGSDIVQQRIRAMALSKRGGPSISIVGSTGSTTFWEPLPIKPKVDVVGVDLNNLRLFLQGGPNSKELLDVWAQTKTDILRRTIRATTEAMCSAALKGQFSYPVAVEGGGYDTFTINYGNLQSLPQGSYKMLDDPTILMMDILKMFVEIRKVFQRLGVGTSQILFWAGEDVFMRLFQLVSKVLTSTKLLTEAGVSLKAEDNYIMIGTIKVELRAEEYTDPETGNFLPIIAPNTLKAICTDAGHRLPYAALDNLDANLEPMPLFIKPYRNPDGSGYTLFGESKPLPVVNTLGLLDVVLLTQD
jgi:hypothetical protein